MTFQSRQIRIDPWLDSKAMSELSIAVIIDGQKHLVKFPFERSDFVSTFDDMMDKSRMAIIVAVKKHKELAHKQAPYTTE